MDNLFRDGDRWVVIGDSLSQNGTYAAWVYLFYATRFPQLKLSIENCGISGDSAGGALRRYDWDIRPKAATVATIMMGMNDVSRRLYADETPTSETLAAREQALKEYRANITQLAKQLQSDGARVVFVTPSPFDDTGDQEVPHLRGVNGALAQCASFLKELAPSIGATVIHLHLPLTKLNLEHQACNPSFTIVGPDRVHPDEAGHFALAHFFLHGQGAPSLVSEVTIDASTQTTQSQNATVTALKVHSDQLEFTSLENALPYPLSDTVKPALNWIPFETEFNQQILRISHLSPGQYALSIDEEIIGDFSSDQLASGLNLAQFSNTPQNRQSAPMLTLLEKWRPLVTQGVRGIAQVEHWQLPDWPHPVSFEKAKPELEALLTTLDIEKEAYNIGVIERYLQVKPKEHQIHQEIQQLASKIRETAQPKPHTYRLERVTT